MTNVDDVIERGALIAGLGVLGSGKTTLIDSMVGYIRKNWVGESMSHYGKQYNIPMFVIAPEKTLRSDYNADDSEARRKYSNLVSGLKKCRVPLTAARLNYIYGRMPENGLIITDDLDWQFKDAKIAISMLSRLGRIWSLMRKKGQRQIHFVTCHSPTIFPYTSWHRLSRLFTHFVLFGEWRGLDELLSTSKETGWRISQLSRLSTQYQYIVYDVRKNVVSMPYDNTNPTGVILALEGKLSNDSGTAKNLQELYVTVAKIVTENPKINLATLSEHVHCSPSAASILVKKARWMGLLPPDWSFHGRVYAGYSGYKGLKPRIIELRKQFPEMTNKEILARMIQEGFETSESYVKKTLCMARKSGEVSFPLLECGHNVDSQNIFKRKGNTFYCSVCQKYVSQKTTTNVAVS